MKMRSVQVVISLLFIGVVSCLNPRDGFYVIQHMTHSKDAVDWGLANNANGFEADFNFNSTGYPTYLKHGFPCDCDCIIDKSNTVCSQLKDGCNTQADAQEMLTYIGSKPSATFMYVDSKVKVKDPNFQKMAGTNIIKFLDSTLFSSGIYRGVALINVETIEYTQYIASAFQASLSSPNKNRYFFTFDWQGKDVGTVISTLASLSIPNRIYSVGQTSCIFFLHEYSSPLMTAESNRQQNTIGASLVWTVDLDVKMKEYLQVPVGGMITNRPKLLYSVATSEGFKMATPKTVIPPSNGKDIQAPCNCSKKLKGCTIASQAPKGTACKCAPLICTASVVKCIDSNSSACVTPDLSLPSCVQGGGDCGGYDDDKCGCSYRSGGCVITSAAAPRTACKCSKIPALPICKGDVVACKNDKNQSCIAPDSSLASCAQGGGDCGGYQ